MHRIFSFLITFQLIFFHLNFIKNIRCDTFFYHFHYICSFFYLQLIFCISFFLFFFYFLFSQIKHLFIKKVSHFTFAHILFALFLFFIFIFTISFFWPSL